MSPAAKSYVTGCEASSPHVIGFADSAEIAPPALEKAAAITCTEAVYTRRGWTTGTYYTGLGAANIGGLTFTSFPAFRSGVIKQLG